MGKEDLLKKIPPAPASELLGQKGVLSWLLKPLGLSPTALVAIALAIFVISMVFFVKGCDGGEEEEKVEAPPDQQQNLDRSATDRVSGPLVIKGVSVEDILDYPVGVEDKTCAWQEFEACQPEEFCSQNQWARAADTPFCCGTSCIDRIQAKDVPIAGIFGETITVEKFETSYAVWWGTSSVDAELDLSITGHENYAETEMVRDDVYMFQADTADGELHSFFIEITDNDTEIEAKQVAG